MNVRELIEQLSKFPPEMKVLRKVRPGGSPEKWEAMDDHWWRMAEVMPSYNVEATGIYYRASNNETGEEVLEI